MVRGKFELADGGTLFLDEVGELPFSLQKAFLRVLQERRFRPMGAKQECESNFRLIAATNRNLDQVPGITPFKHYVTFREALLQGQAPDEGLFMPEPIGAY